MTTATGHSVDCTVVIPVFNRGEALDAGAESLRAQSLPADRIEIIYVDDGSNDGTTPVLIDQTVAALPNALAFHELASGSPGRPRNIGLARATGEFVFFADHDDWFDAKALERLVKYARANDSDVVIGKVVAHGRRVAIPRIFRESHASLPAAEAMISLTPHKLFRREFLLDHDIRYPEGRIRLEDHHFVTHAYLHARKISVYADHVCYHHNHPGGDENFSRSAADPETYISSNREVIELVIRHTEQDAALRAALLVRPVQHELIKKAGPRRLAQLDADGASRKHAALHAALVETVPAEVVDRLGAFPRATARALLNDDPSAVRRIDDHEQRLALGAEATSFGSGPASLTIGYRVVVEHDGSPVLFHPAGPDAWRLDETVLDPIDLDRDEREADLLSIDVEFLVSHRRSDVQWHLLNRIAPMLEASTVQSPAGGARSARLVVLGKAELSADDLAGARLRPGVWDVKLRAEVLGVGLATRLKAPEHSPDQLPSLTLPTRSLRASFVVTPKGNLALDVERVAPRRQS
ncbi:MAG TPA: glycosyltransferase family 2 protein [Mycobacteriales bacterium]|nr:glycosyltransferase family 2 protein [Mycobacteriales bacterium]